SPLMQTDTKPTHRPTGINITKKPTTNQNTHKEHPASHEPSINWQTNTSKYSSSKKGTQKRKPTKPTKTADPASPFNRATKNMASITRHTVEFSKNGRAPPEPHTTCNPAQGNLCNLPNRSHPVNLSCWDSSARIGSVL